MYSLINFDCVASLSRISSQNAQNNIRKAADITQQKQLWLLFSLPLFALVFYFLLLVCYSAIRLLAASV